MNFTSYFTQDARNNEDEFTDLVAVVGAMPSRDVSALPFPAQASVVAAWFRSTRAPDKLLLFLHSSELMAEVTRRGAETEALRYAPLFERGWRGAYLRLAAVIKHSCEGSTALAMASSMVVQVAGTPDVTTGSVAALEMALEERRLSPRDHE